MVPTNTTGTTGTTGNTGSSPGYSDMKDDLQKSGEELSQTMKGKRDELSQDAKGKAEGAKSYAADEMDTLSHAAEAAADALGEENHEKLSSYVNDIAGYVGSMADSLRNRSADDLVSDAKRMAHKNPSLFIAGGIAMGLGLARIAKSGTQGAKENQAPSYDSYGTGESTLTSDTSDSSFSSTGGTGAPSAATSSSETAKAGSLDSDFYKKSNQYDKV